MSLLQNLEGIDGIFVSLQNLDTISLYKATKSVIHGFILPYSLQMEQRINSFFDRNQFTSFDQAIVYLVIIWSCINFLQIIISMIFFLIKKREIGIQATLYGLVVKYLPYARKKFEASKKELQVTLDESIDKMSIKKCVKLPQNGAKQTTLMKRLDEWIERDNKISFSGKISGGRYPEHIDFEKTVTDFAKNFLYHNPLHFELFPASRQMEAEVIKMTCGLFGSEDGYGLITSGGTESIMMGVLSHRNYAAKFRGITKPNLVMPITAHPAFIKACNFFQVQCIRVPVGENSVVCPKQMAKFINSNTIMIVGSVPNFPHGTVDPISELGALAKSKGIGFHLDCCLGGFVVAFAKDVGIEIPKCDFTVEGVTSISCDHHKYGLAPKGVSICMFKSIELRQCCYTQVSNWAGGLYATSSQCGSKSGAPAAGAWFAMMMLGRDGYVENAKKITQAVNEVVQGIKKQEELAELEIIGDPKSVCVAFKYKKGVNKNIYYIEGALSKKGWHLSGLQLPPGIHISVTPGNANLIKNQFIRDLKACLKEVDEDPSKFKDTMSASLYGASVQIPDSRIMDSILEVAIDCILKV